MPEYGIFLDESGVSVYVLQPRQAEQFADLVADGEEEQPAAVLAKCSHHFGGGGISRPQKIGLTFPEGGVENHHRIARSERRDGLLDARGHE